MLANLASGRRTCEVDFDRSRSSSIMAMYEQRVARHGQYSTSGYIVGHLSKRCLDAAVVGVCFLSTSTETKGLSHASLRVTEVFEADSFKAIR